MRKGFVLRLEVRQGGQPYIGLGLMLLWSKTSKTSMPGVGIDW
jgi:hypothetical protein